MVRVALNTLVLAMYQELARKQRAELQLKGKGKTKLSKQVVSAADDPREQVMVRAVNQN